jgi:hypothetical protein
MYQQRKWKKNKKVLIGIKIMKWQHHIKLIASSSLLTKVLTDFLSVIYLLTLVLKPCN